MLIIRQARWPDDLPALHAIDNSFTTLARCHVEPCETGFHLIEEQLEIPLHKTYPLDDEAPLLPAMDYVAVAELDGRIVGFCAVQFSAWNRRAVLHHLYVDGSARRRGIGRALLNHAQNFARRTGAWCLWLETQDINLPAIHFYRAEGFRLCGLDTALYDPAGPGAGETALFFMKKLE